MEIPIDPSIWLAKLNIFKIRYFTDYEAYKFVESVRRTKSKCIVICDVEIVKTHSNVFLTHKIQVNYLIKIVWVCISVAGT